MTLDESGKQLALRVYTTMLEWGESRPLDELRSKIPASREQGTDEYYLTVMEEVIKLFEQSEESCE